ncbi:DinB family protein [Ureibacillus sinduriensis]|uniref:Damage-inducible protein DinB n=1 Tax=Ureibacillus sinduriensis BLB-1 = JCM 15800 TaxID=1384057 RepID=A0A0A3I209_9BACL|nr:DinB family protein [Ureibacillus sinduriensis]KGR77545.1 damage-inducible protein DinB [Ureibacillus sinduriensis BLB-1 = JCM 15800]
MYRTLNDFVSEWEKNCRGTLAIFESITDEKKHVAIVEGHSSLESLSWHLTTSPAYFMGQVGLSLEVELNPKSTPATISEIVSIYKSTSDNVVKVAKENLSDVKLLTEVNSHGRPTPIGALLRVMVDHQTHHRAQMQVLLRQAGLPVPGVMGPTKEDLAK